ncbi:EAL domain-containing protein [Thioalkalivibrio sp.]|uniref:EAL domain-containing protein n=1 Tax=Thioalkalivibrio sp. TaxID=2093813 RepID=UPI003974C0E0
MLVVRLCGDTVPKSWNRWGRPLTRDSVHLWAFPLPAGMDLANLVRALVLETPHDLLESCLAVWINPDFDGRLPISVLDELEPLSVLHTRLHEPWIMGELGKLVHPGFQPVVSLAGSGRLFGYQMPCLLEHPDRGEISGPEFYLLARHARRLEAVEQACQIAALARRSEYLPTGVPTFIRAFPRSLLQHDPRRHPSYTCLERLGVNPRDIVIEVADRGQVDDIDALINSCGVLRSMGFRIALDEVGAGMGHVGLMVGLEPEFIWLDRGLIEHARQSATGGSLLEGLVATARGIGAATVADGLDDAGSLGLCRELGVDFGQGDLVGPCAQVPAAPRSLPPPA